MLIDDNLTPECLVANFQQFIEAYKPLILNQEPNPNDPGDDTDDEIFPISTRDFLHDTPDGILMNEHKCTLLQQVDRLNRDVLIDLLKCQSQDLSQEFVVFDILADIGVLKRNMAGLVVIPRGQFKDGCYSKTAYFTYLLLASLKRDGKFKCLYEYLSIQVDNFFKLYFQPLNFTLENRMHLCFTSKLEYKSLYKSLVIIEIDNSGISEELKDQSINSTIARFTDNALVRIDTQDEELLKYAYGEIENSTQWDLLVQDVINLISGMLYSIQPLNDKLLGSLCKQSLIDKISAMQKLQNNKSHEVRSMILNLTSNYMRVIDNFCQSTAFTIFAMKYQWDKNRVKIQMSQIYKLLKICNERQKTDIFRFLDKKGCAIENYRASEVEWVDLLNIICALANKSQKFMLIHEIYTSVMQVYSELESNLSQYNFTSAGSRNIFQCLRDHDMIMNLCQKQFNKRFIKHKNDFHALHNGFRRTSSIILHADDEGVDC